MIAALIPLILIQFDLVATEYPEEFLIVNASLLILPEMINELLNIIIINPELLHVLEDVLEVLSGERAALFLVKKLEGIIKGLDAGPAEALYDEVDDLLLGGAALNAMAGEFPHEFPVLDGAVVVHVDGSHEHLHFLGAQVLHL